MGKALVIQGANFSSVAIGHVDIPRELSEEAKRWIAASGNTSMSDVQKFAVDTFITETASLKSKIHKLYLPMLANGVNKSLVNYATLADDAPRGIFDYLDYESGGICSKGTSYLDFKTITMNAGVWSNDLSIFVCHTKDLAPIASGTSDMPVVGLGTAATDRAIYFSRQYTSRFAFCADIDRTVQLDITKFINDTSAVFLAKGVRGVIFGEASYTGMKNDGTFGAMEYPTGVTHKAHTRLCLMSTGALSGFCESNVPYGMIFVGKQMTKQEATILKTATEALMNAFVG